jgi:sugar transferase (PEP-CTERM/EpsH1 system associated)
MRILFVAPYVPSRMRIRPLGLIRELARRGHQVTLVCLVQPAAEIEYLEDIAPYCEEVHPVQLNRRKAVANSLASLPTRMPLSVAYCKSDNLREITTRLMHSRSYDILHTEFIRAAQATAELGGIPKVFDAVDSLGLAYRRSVKAAYVPLTHRLVSIFESIKMPGYEKSLLQKFDHTLVSSPADKAHLSPGDQSHMSVLPNGVDLDYFSFFDGKRESDTIVFLGKMSYYINVASVLWFYREIFPLIRKEAPAARLLIVGRDPDARILDLRRDPCVEVTGTVPDVRAYLKKAMVAICPMVSGSGIQNKLLEAMAVGTPSVVTNLAAQALEKEAENAIVNANNPEEFAQCVLKLLKVPSFWEKISLNGRRFVETNHDWTIIGAQLEGIHYQVTHPFIG